MALILFGEQLKRATSEPTSRFQPLSVTGKNFLTPMSKTLQPFYFLLCCCFRFWCFRLINCKHGKLWDKIFTSPCVPSYSFEKAARPKRKEDRTPQGFSCMSCIKTHARRSVNNICTVQREICHMRVCTTIPWTDIDWWIDSPLRSIRRRKKKTIRAGLHPVFQQFSFCSFSPSSSTNYLHSLDHNAILYFRCRCCHCLRRCCWLR